MKTPAAKIWDGLETSKKNPGAAEKTITAWESKAGVKLPQFLREAIRAQNGGKVRYSSLMLFPLKSIVRKEGQFWEFAFCEDKEFEEKSLIFAFGESEAGEPTYFLNFNANGPTGEPSIYHYFGDPGEFVLEKGDFEEFIATQMAVSDTPDVSLEEADKLNLVLHRETILRHLEDGSEWRVETVVGQRDGQLWIYKDERIGDKITVEKTGLAKPFDPEAIIDTSPFSPPVHTLRIDSRKEDASVEARSERFPDGKWKNFHASGVLCGFVESADKNHLIQLRAKILGTRLLARAEKAQRQHDETTAQAAAMAALSMEERKAVGMEIARILAESLDPSPKAKNMDAQAIQNVVGKVLRDRLNKP